MVRRTSSATATAGRRPHASLALHRLHDDGRRAVGGDDAVGGGPVLERDDAHAGDERLERLAVVGPVGGRERGEQPPVERAGEGHDLGLARPLAGELERGLVRFRPRVAEEDAIGERAGDELFREPLTRLGAVQVGDMHEPALERAEDGRADHGVVVAQGVDGDPRDEVEVAGAVVRDDLRALAGDEQRADSGIHAEQGLRSGGRDRHAGCGVAARTRVPAVGWPSRRRSPMRTACAPVCRAAAPARSFVAIPSVATPSSISASMSDAATQSWATPSTTTPGTSETYNSSVARPPPSAPGGVVAGGPARFSPGRPGRRDGAAPARPPPCPPTPGSSGLGASAQAASPSGGSSSSPPSFTTRPLSTRAPPSPPAPT